MFRNRGRFGAAYLAVGLSSVVAAGGAVGQHRHGDHAGQDHSIATGGGAKAVCDRVELSCARTATPVFGPDGRAWVVFDAGGRVAVARSSDGGQTFAPPVVLPATELLLDNGPDARPRLALGADGTLAVTYASRDERYNGRGFVAISRDGGATFGAPEPLTSQSPSQRFEVAAFTPDGRLFAAWIDKRGAAAARVKGEAYAGAALAVSHGKPSEAGGVVSQARIVIHNTCECCRLAVAFTPDGRPAILFRNIFAGGVRDHGVITLAADGTAGPVRRVSDDDWATDACPHHGPSLSIGPDGTFHATWFTAGRKAKGVYYARSEDGGETFGPPIPLRSGTAQASRPYVHAAGGGVVHLVYKSFDGETTTVEHRISRDDGRSWTPPRTVARTSGTSDHPQIVAGPGRVLLSWLTADDGLRLIGLEGQS